MENPHSAKGSVGADELRATIALAVPVVLVQLGFMAMGVVDTLMVGRVSARVLAAVALGNLYYFNVTILATGSLMALDPIVAQAVGAGETESVARAMQRGLIIAVGFCLFCVLCIAPAPTVLTDAPAAAARSSATRRRTCGSRSPDWCRISCSSCCDRACKPCIASRRSCGR